jgi:glycosyltransferase involved in cell wall biosynthesis
VKPLRVCIEARLPEAEAGGCQQVLIGLAAGLSSLTDADDEYLFVAHAAGSDWLTRYLAGPCRPLLLPAAAPAGRGAARRLAKRIAPAPVRDLLRRGRAVVRALRQVPLPVSDGTFERTGCDLIHFPFQGAFLTDVPSIYHPHDLQHLHLPQYFTPEIIRHREATYRAFCARAAMVAVTSTWVKEDLVAHYGLPREKIGVVPLAPVLDAYPVPAEGDLAAARARLSLPRDFAFYPAQTWPHKNHLGLIRALAGLRDEGRAGDIHFVFSGMKNQFHAEIDREVVRLGLAERVCFVGFVTPMELQCLYRLARCAVIPSKFEAASFPLWEAFLAGVPAACARVTSLPAQAGDAALLFDPDDTRDIGAALARLWTDADLRATLAARGRAAVERFTWQRTARLFRAHYRRLLRRPPTEEDRALLAAPPAL